MKSITARRLAMEQDETTTGNGGVKKEIQASKDDASGNKTEGVKQGGVTDEDLDPSAKPDPTEVPAGTEPNPASDVVEPPAPGKKSEGEMALPPETFLEPSESVGGNGSKEGAQAASESANANDDGQSADPNAPNPSVVDDMAAKGSLNDALKEAFAAFIEGQKEDGKVSMSRLAGQAVRTFKGRKCFVYVYNYGGAYGWELYRSRDSGKIEDNSGLTLDEACREAQTAVSNYDRSGNTGLSKLAGALTFDDHPANNTKVSDKEYVEFLKMAISKLEDAISKAPLGGPKMQMQRELKHWKSELKYMEEK